MSSQRDYYEVLGVPRESSLDEIKLAYRKLARQYHPDLAKENKKEAEDRFKEINEAFEVLSNQDKRARYDRFGHAAAKGAPGFGEGFGGFTGFEVFDDLFESFFGGGMGAGAGGRDQAGGRRRRGQRREARGRDVRADVEITLLEAIKGIAKEISFQGYIRCAECGGAGAKGDNALERCRHCGGMGEVEEVTSSFFGQIIRTSPCPICRGMGEILKSPCIKCNGRGIHEGKRRLQVQVPAGIEDGTGIRHRNEGEPGEHGGPAGDLYLFVHIQEDPRFRREGKDIYFVATLSYPEVVLGTEVEVPTLHGPEILRVPAGTQVGSTFRIKGKGMPLIDGRGHGDQIVVIKVDVPKNITDKQRQSLLDYAKVSGIKVKEDKGFFGKVKDAFGS